MRQLVDHGDVDGAERVLEQLHHLGHARRAHRHDRVHHLRVKRHRGACAVVVDAADDLRDVLGLVVRVARVDALGRKRQVEIHARLEALRRQRRLHHLHRRPGIRGRLEDDQLPFPEHRRRRLDRLDHVGHVGVLGLAQRRRHADVDDVDVAKPLRVGGRHELAALDHFREVRRRHVRNVAAARHQFGDLLLIDVVADHRKAGAGEFDRERQADVAEADDAELGLLRLDLLQQFHGVIRGRNSEWRRPRTIAGRG